MVASSATVLRAQRLRRGQRIAVPLDVEALPAALEERIEADVVVGERAPDVALVEEALRLLAEHRPLLGERGELGKTAHVLERFRGHGREQEDERVVRRQQRRVIEELAGETEPLAAAQVHVERRKHDGVENQEFGREDLADHGDASAATEVSGRTIES